MKHLEKEWLMLAAATLAGGGKAKDAIANADAITKAFQKRLEDGEAE